MSVGIGDLEQYVLKILQPERRETNGTGFFCHPDGYILTCYHVIEPHLKAGRNDVNINCCNHLSCGQKRFPLFELFFALEFKPQDLILEPWYF